MRTTENRHGLPLRAVEWGAPRWVRAFSTTRSGGVSAGPWGLADGSPGGLNLGEHCGDSPAAVASNRALVRCALPADPCWLRQVHGAGVFDADSRGQAAQTPVEADAALTTTDGRVLAIQTADCLPVLFVDQHSRMVAAAHAGWRGLALGVLEATIDAMCVRGAKPSTILAWCGPAIGPGAFEVGDEVRQVFVDRDPGAARRFHAGARTGKWWCDLPGLARDRLGARGVLRVTDSGECTVGDRERYYSYRRDGVTGRMASLIWIDTA